jgi:hypothetical protein
MDVDETDLGSVVVGAAVMTAIRWHVEQTGLGAKWNPTATAHTAARHTTQCAPQVINQPVQIPLTHMRLVWRFLTNDSAPHAWFRAEVQAISTKILWRGQAA